MKILILGILVISMGLASCGWKEDALEGKTQGTQDAQKPKEEKPRPGDVDQLLRISTSADTFKFIEEQKRKYVITGSVLVDSAEYLLTVENLADFPEADGKTASFDQATGAFTWTPPLGFVDTITEKQMVLKVTLVTTNLPVQRSRSAEIEVRVIASEKLPVIESITFEGNRRKMREGEVLNFDVVVKDTSSQPAIGSQPSLIFLPTKDNDFEAASVIEMVKIPDVANPELKDPNDPYTWTFHLQIDLRTREVTTGSITMRMNVVAISNFKQRSEPMTSNVDILTNLKKPQISWQNTWTFKAGVNNYNVLTVYDPRNEAKLDVKFNLCSQIHPKLSCGPCVSNTDSGFEVWNCPVTWDIPADYYQKGGKELVQIPFKVMTKSKIPYDNFNLPDIPMTGQIKVLHADDPANPGPAPLPTTNAGDK